MNDELRKLTDKEINDLIGQIREAQGFLLFKYPNIGVFRARASDSIHPKFLICSEPKDLPAKVPWEQPAAINLTLDDEVYFFKSGVRRDKKNLQITIPKEVFHLQRRKKRRIRIPEDHPAFFLIQGGDGSSLLKATVLDISIGGVRLALASENPKYKELDKLSGQLCIGENDSFAVSGIIRHHKMTTVENQKQVFGLEFMDLPQNLANQIEKIVLDLQREFFLRMLD